MKVGIEVGVVVDALLAAGYNLTVFDGRYETVTRTVVRDQIVSGMRSAPVDHLLAYRDDRPDADGWVRLDYGNESVTCSTSLNGIVNAVNDDHLPPTK